MKNARAVVACAIPPRPLTVACVLALTLALAAVPGCHRAVGPPLASDESVARAPMPESDKGRLTPADAGASESDAVETTALPAFSATIWKRDVISEEPILLKLEVTNARNGEVLIVAPYFDSYACANYPLTLSVTDASGHALQNSWEFADSGYEPIHRGRPWWVPDGRVQAGDVEPRAWRAWRIPAGATAYMWCNMLQFYPLDDSGEYHIVLKYDSTPEMLFEPGQKKDNPPKDVLCWSAEIDAGWVTVTEPGPKDAAASANLRDMPDVQGVVFGTNFAESHKDLRVLDTGGADWLRGTSYEPYVRFARAFYRSESQSTRDAGGLPLEELLRTVGPRRLAEKSTYNPPDLYRRPLDEVAGKSAAEMDRVRADLRMAARRSVEAYDAAVRVARESGDYSILGYIERPAAVNLYAVKLHFPDWPN